MKEAEAVMRDFADECFHPLNFPGYILSHLPADQVDSYMAALPEDVREIAIDYVQTTFASGKEGFRLRHPDSHEIERENALCDWVRRQGRYHWPRRPYEPDVAAASKRLGEPVEDDLDFLLRRKPWKSLSWFEPADLDSAMARLPEETRQAVAAWAAEQFANVAALPAPRPWFARRGAEVAMIDWLRRHGHLP